MTIQLSVPAKDSSVISVPATRSRCRRRFWYPLPSVTNPDIRLRWCPTTLRCWTQCSRRNYRPDILATRLMVTSIIRRV